MNDEGLLNGDDEDEVPFYTSTFDQLRRGAGRGRGQGRGGAASSKNRPSSSSSANNQKPASRKIHAKSALCVLAPPEICGPIENIRKDHDKAYARWPPHINVMYPFYEDIHFDDIVKEISAVVNKPGDSIVPFDVVFKEFDYFVHKSSSTLWLRPEIVVKAGNDDSTWDRLYAKLTALYPDCAEAELRPHLSVGQWPISDVNVMRQKYNETWTPLTFTVDKLALISRQGFDDRFELKTEILLSQM